MENCFDIKWKEELIWCPSQIYGEGIVYNNHKYTIYLRWRYEDPWRNAAVIDITDVETEGIEDGKWFCFDIPYFIDEEYKLLEKYVEDNIEEIIKKSTKQTYI